MLFYMEKKSSKQREKMKKKLQIAIRGERRTRIDIQSEQRYQDNGDVNA